MTQSADVRIVAAAAGKKLHLLIRPYQLRHLSYISEEKGVGSGRGSACAEFQKKISWLNHSYTQVQVPLACRVYKSGRRGVLEILNQISVIGKCFHRGKLGRFPRITEFSLSYVCIDGKRYGLCNGNPERRADKHGNHPKKR